MAPLLSMHSSELIITTITVGIAYIVTTTFAGFFQAWIAQKCGDDTAAQAGYLTLNPFMHIDPVGAICLFLLGIGWGKIIPIDPDQIKGTFKKLLVFLARPFGYMISAFFAFISLVGFFGVQGLRFITIMVASDYISLGALSKAYPDSSSLILSLALILIMFVYLGVMFAVLNLIIDGFRFMQLLYSGQSQTTEFDFVMFFIPLLLMILFARPLKYLVIHAIAYAAYGLLALVGII